MRLVRPIPLRASALPPLALLLPMVLGGAMALASAPVAAQQVYKWKDAAGVTHFTAEPPPKGQHYEAREVDHHEAVPPAPQAAADTGDAKPAAGEDPGCATARSNLELLKGTAKVMVDSNGDGKPDNPLADADRVKQRQLAEATIAVKCSGGAPTQAAEPEER